MAWTHRTATTGFGFGETSVDVTVPGSIANLDVVDVWILCADPSDNVTCTAPDGDWTQRISVGEQDFGTRLFCFTKVSDGSEGATWVFTLSSAQDHLFLANAAAGGTGSLTGTSASGTSAGGSTTYTSPSITPTVDGALVRAGFAVDTNNDCTPITADTSPAATADGTIRAGAEQHLFVEHYEQPSAGAVTLDSTWNAAPATFVTKGVLAWAQAEEAPTGVLVVPPIRRVF
jgi:hypothetical protein